MTRERQAAARQRSAPRHADAVARGTSRTSPRGDFEVIGGDASRHAGGRARPQPLHRLGRDQRRRRRRGSLSRAPRRRRHARRVPRRAGADHGDPGNDRRQGRARRCTLNVRVTRHGPLVSDAINANNAESKTTPKPPPRRAARVPLDGARSRRRHADGVPQAERGAQLERVHRRAAAASSCRRRTSSTPTSTATSATTRRGAFRCARPATARGRPTAGPATPSGPAGCRSTSCRTPTIRPSTSSSPRTTGPRRRRIRYNLGLEWTEPYRAQRITDLSPVSGCSRTHAASRRTISRASRPTRCRSHAQALLPLLLARASGRLRRRPAGARRCCAHGTSTRRGDSAAAAIFEAWFLQLAPALVGDELGAARHGRPTQGKFSFVSRFLAEHAGRRTTAPWCDDVTTPERETCDDAVTTALRKGVDDLAAAARQRHDALALGRRAPRDLSARARLGRGAAADPQPLGRQRRRLEHRQRRRVRRRSSVRSAHVPGYREIIDLSPANDSRFLDAVGESGHPLSPHYDDFLKDWHAVKHRKMRMERADIDHGALGHLRLDAVVSNAQASRRPDDAKMAVRSPPSFFDESRPMDQDVIATHLEDLDRRVAKVEQILPTLATKEDLRPPADQGGSQGARADQGSTLATG